MSTACSTPCASATKTAPRLVHRLDRDTSGLLLLARTPGAAAKLAAGFRGRNIEKTYWAVVVGLPDPASGKIDRPVARIGAGGRGERTSIATLGDPNASHAITTYETLDVVGKRFAWLAMSPQTGRTHQLPPHAASMGTPILGNSRKYEVNKEPRRRLQPRTPPPRPPPPLPPSQRRDADAGGRSAPPHARDVFGPWL